MESQLELVRAAEALCTWVHGQRATWSDPPSPAIAVPVLPVLQPVPVPAFHVRPVVSEPPVQAPPPVQPAEPPPMVPVARPPVTTAPPLVAVLTTPVPPPAPAVLPPDRPVIHPVLTAATLSASQRPRGRRWVRAALVCIAVAIAAGAAISRMTPKAGVAVARIGTAAFASVPPGAQVLVDGNPVGMTPVRVELPAGQHAVEFRLKASRRSQTIDIARDRETAVNVDWNARRVGALQVSTTPAGAKVIIDGHERGMTPLTVDSLVVGSHTVQIESTDGTVRRKVQIGEGSVETLAESIYPGWLHVSAPIDVTVTDGAKPVQLDAANRVLLKPGTHTLHIQNRALAFSVTRQVEIEPGGTANVAVDVSPSTLTVTGSTGADVFVDGVKAGETPLVDYEVALGQRDIMVVDRSGATRHASVTVTSKPAQLEIGFARP
jgi:CRISPR/Cas system-associated exonuclease Cas4 (RecB family)